MTTRYYFSDDNINSLVALLEKRPIGEHKILIGSDNSTPIVSRILAQLNGHDRTLAEWVIQKIAAQELEIRVMPKTDLPQGVDLSTEGN
jgi:hypothetical protein